MKFLRAHPYSALSLLLTGSELVVVFGATSHTFPGTPLPEGSLPLRELDMFGLVLAFLSFLTGGLGVDKETAKRTPIIVTAIAACAYFLCGMRMAV
jgi:hypothetical protein